MEEEPVVSELVASATSEVPEYERGLGFEETREGVNSFAKDMDRGSWQ